MTDRQRVQRAFAALRARGYVARANFMCCAGCGWDAAARQATETGRQRGIVFYHQQEAENFGRDGNLTSDLHLQWSGSAAEIMQALIAAGCSVAHPDDTGTTIYVVHVPITPACGTR